MNPDFVVVGGGSAGCVITCRLAEAGFRVTLLEAGGRNTLLSQVPARVPALLGSKKTNWDYPALPDHTRAGNDDPWPAGKLLGGSSAVNGMMYVRGHRRDYDAWSQLGAAGWSYDDVEPFFTLMEHSERGPGEGRGQNGPQWASERRDPHRLDDVFIQAAQELGIPRNTDMNNGTADGVDYCQLSQKKGHRHSTASAYLMRARLTRRVTVLTGAHVQRILFTGDKASAVEYERSGRQQQMHANNGVVLSSGAMATPKLLLLSGIGDEAQLADHRIPVVTHLPGVGENLQEHVALRTSAHVNVPTLTSELSAWKMPGHLFDFLLHGRGPLTMPVGHAHAFARSRAHLESPNIQLIFSPFALQVSGGQAGIYKTPAITIAVGLCRTDARGRVRLSSSDARVPPQIFFEAFTNKDDLEQLKEGARLARRFYTSEAFAPYVTTEHLPGSSVQSDDEWRRYIKNNAFLMYHPCGTCRIGTDPLAVVNPALNVHGVNRLWVADASVMPTLVAGNINATCIMIGEKGARHIIEATQ